MKQLDIKVGRNVSVNVYEDLTLGDSCFEIRLCGKAICKLVSAETEAKKFSITPKELLEVTMRGLNAQTPIFN